MILVDGLGQRWENHFVSAIGTLTFVAYLPLLITQPPTAFRATKMVNRFVRLGPAAEKQKNPNP
jgi:hypothetical protein